MTVVLEYHKVTGRFQLAGTTVAKAQLDSHIRELKKLGFEFPDLSSLKKTLLENDKRKIIFTFDDGFQSIYKNALPVFEKHGLKGIVFISTAYIGKFNSWDTNLGFKFPHLSIEEIRELHRHGWLIGSHGHKHLDLTRISTEQAYKELKLSKEILEDIIGTDVKILSYPYGNYSEAVKEIAKELGYEIAFSSIRGNPGDIMAYPRRAIYLIDMKLYRKFDPFWEPFEIKKEQIINGFAQLSSWIKHNSRILAKFFGIKDDKIC